LGRWGGGTGTPSLASLKAAAAAVGCLALVAFSGCGAAEGVAEGATVSVYVGAPLCPEAKAELAKRGAAVGAVKVRIECLGPDRHGGRLDLAAVGADARRAVQDSSSVALIAAPGPAVSFTRPIVKEAQITTIVSSSGGAALAQVLTTLASRGDELPREALWTSGPFTEGR
jgi:hypothetical protein